MNPPAREPIGTSAPWASLADVEEIREGLERFHVEYREFMTSEYQPFVIGLMGSAQFPGGAFGRMEAAVRELSENLRHLPEQFEKAIDNHTTIRRGLLLNAGFRRLDLIFVSVVVALIVAMVTGHVPQFNVKP